MIISIDQSMLQKWWKIYLQFLRAHSDDLTKGQKKLKTFSLC